MTDFSSGLRRTVAATGLTLALFAASVTGALAEDLPKQGTYSTTWAFSGPYTVVQVGEDDWAWMSNFSILYRNDAGTGIFHNMTSDCIGLGHGEEGNGYCAWVDAEGNKIFSAWKDLGGGKGATTLLGGTGKYAGLQGSEEYDFVFFPDNPDGRFHGWGHTKGSYTLP